MVQLLEPLVGGDGQADAAAGLTGQLRGGLLAEQPEQVAGPLQVTARRGLGVGEQAHDQADHDRVHAGLEERHPGRRPEQEVGRPEPHARGPDGQHRHQDAHPRQQRGQLQARAVKNRNNGQSDQIIHDGEGEQVGAHPVGQPGADQGQHAQRERGVGGHGRAPAPGPRAARVGRQVDADRDDHPAQADHQRERQPPALAQLAHVELAPGLQADHQEEERHQAGVHPAVQVIGQAHAADAHRQPGGPERAVGPRPRRWPRPARPPSRPAGSRRCPSRCAGTGAAGSPGSAPTRSGRTGAEGAGTDSVMPGFSQYGGGGRARLSPQGRRRSRPRPRRSRGLPPLRRPRRPRRCPRPGRRGPAQCPGWAPSSSATRRPARGCCSS